MSRLTCTAVCGLTLTAMRALLPFHRRVAALVPVSTPTCLATWLTLRFGFRSLRISIVCLTENVLKRKVRKPSSPLTAGSMFASASGRDPGASQCLNIQAQSDTNLRTFSPDLIQPEGKLLFITPNGNGTLAAFYFPLTWFCWSGWRAYHQSALFCSGRNRPRCRCAYEPG